MMPNRTRIVLTMCDIKQKLQIECEMGIQEEKKITNMVDSAYVASIFF